MTKLPKGRKFGYIKKSILQIYRITDNKFYEKLFTDTVPRDINCRYILRFLFKNNVDKFGDSHIVAVEILL